MLSIEGPNDIMSIKDPTFYYKNNRLQQLRGFCYAAQFGNITKAARAMGLTQSSVSLQIKSLEDELGVQLFHRKGPHISLSREGEEMLKMALPHIEGIHTICERFKHIREETKKTEIIVGVNSTAKNYLAPPIVNKYVDKYEKTNVTLYFAEQDTAAGMIESDEMDCAILPRRPHKPFPDSCEYTPVFFFKACLITRFDHPLAGRDFLTIEEISKYEVILPSYDLRVIPNLYEVFDLEKIEKRRRVNFVNMETGREFIDAGLIITISSNVFVKPNDPTLVATPLPHLFEDVDYGILTRKGKKHSRNLTNFISTARDHAREISRLPKQGT